jgi:hypothetical protein
MRVYAEPPLKDNAISRIADAVKKYAPAGVEFVESEEEAELVVIYVHGFRRAVWYQTGRLRDQKKKFAIVQLCIRGTPNPKTEDWIPIWREAKVVWSYYDLPALCQEDGNDVIFNFYHAPLGVDPEIFRETPAERKFLIASTGTGRGWNKESKNQVLAAAEGKPVFQLGFGQNEQNVTYSNGIPDAELAKYYSQCRYVAGLRRIEGFELPVIEGLLCGARPVCFDRPHYDYWFGSLVEYIPEDGAITENLRKLFTQDPRSVTDEEKAYVRKNFNWNKIIGDFWCEIL